MARRFLNLVSLVCLVGFVGTFAHAQTDMESRRFTFSVVGQPVPQEEIFYQSEGEVFMLEFQPFRRSPNYEYVGRSSIAFAKRVPLDSTTSEGAKFEVIGQVQVSPLIRHPLFLFFPDRENRQRFKIFAIEDDAAAFKFGSLSIFNYSGFRLRGTVGRLDTVLEENQNSNFPFSSSGEVQLALEHRGRLVPAFDQKLQVGKTERLVLILLPPQRASSPLLQWIFLTDHEEQGSKSR